MIRILINAAPLLSLGVYMAGQGYTHGSPRGVHHAYDMVDVTCILKMHAQWHWYVYLV